MFPSLPKGRRGPDAQTAGAPPGGCPQGPGSADRAHTATRAPPHAALMGLSPVLETVGVRADEAGWVAAARGGRTQAARGAPGGGGRVLCSQSPPAPRGF